MIRLCIFDLDGTTVNSLRSIAYFANETLKKYGFSPFPEDDYRHLAGGGAKALWTNIVKASGAPEDLLEPMKNAWLRAYEADFLYLTEGYAGVTDMLRALKDAGIRTAVVTNKAKAIADKICASCFGAALLDEVISDHPGMVLKPAPDELIKLKVKYGLRDNEVMYCGDHTIDMVTGKNAGAVTVGVTWGFHTAEALKNAGADYVADVPADILKFATQEKYR